MSNQSDGIGQLAKALASVQSELPAARKDATNPMLRSRYADLGSVWESCRDLLPRHGLAIVQRGVAVGEAWGLETVLAHESGEWISGVVPLHLSPNKGVNEMQALGSATTYARRYGLAAILGIVADDDDDGNSAGRQDQSRERPTANGHSTNEGPPNGQDNAGKFWSFVDGLVREFGAENRHAVVNRIYQFASKDGHVDGAAKRPSDKAAQLREWVKNGETPEIRKAAVAYLKGAADPNSPEFANP